MTYRQARAELRNVRCTADIGFIEEGSYGSALSIVGVRMHGGSTFRSEFEVYRGGTCIKVTSRIPLLGANFAICRAPIVTVLRIIRDREERATYGALTRNESARDRYQSRHTGNEMLCFHDEIIRGSRVTSFIL